MARLASKESRGMISGMRQHDRAPFGNACSIPTIYPDDRTSSSAADDGQVKLFDRQQAATPKASRQDVIATPQIPGIRLTDRPTQ